jgi:hypothetical protein
MPAFANTSTLYATKVILLEKLLGNTNTSRHMNAFFEQRSVAYLCSSKIVIASMNNRSQDTWYHDDEVTMLPLDSTNENVANYVLRHLSLSKFMEITYDDIRVLYKRFLSNGGYKTEKSFFSEAKRVSVVRELDLYCFMPFNSKPADKIFLGIPGQIQKRPLNIGPDGFAETLRDCWDKCNFIN